MIFQYLKLKGWENQKVHYYGHTRSWSQMGSALSSLIAAAIVFGSEKYSAVFLFSLIPYVVDLLLMASYPKVLEGESESQKNESLINIFKKVFREFVFSFKNIRVLKAITNMSAFSGYYKAVKDYLQPVIQTFALSLPLFLTLDSRKKEAVMIGIIYSLLYFATAFASRSSGTVADKFKNLARPLNLSLIVGLIIGILVGLFYKLNLAFLSVLFFSLIYMLENLRRPMAISYVTEQLNQNILASVLSAESQANTVFAAIIAVLFGFFADKFGIEISFICISLGLLIISPLYFITRDQNKK